MPNETKDAKIGTATQGTDSKANGRGKKKSREERGLPPLTNAQRMTKSLIQNAQNSCQFLKEQVESGEPIPEAVLNACGVLAGAMGAVLGE